MRRHSRGECRRGSEKRLPSRDRRHARILRHVPLDDRLQSFGTFLQDGSIARKKLFVYSHTLQKKDTQCPCSRTWTFRTSTLALNPATRRLDPVERIVPPGGHVVAVAPLDLDESLHPRGVDDDPSRLQVRAKRYSVPCVRYPYETLIAHAGNRTRAAILEGLHATIAPRVLI